MSEEGFKLLKEAGVDIFALYRAGIMKTFKELTDNIDSIESEAPGMRAFLILEFEKQLQLLKEAHDK